MRYDNAKVVEAPESATEAEDMTSDDYRGTVAAKTKDGYAIIRRMPGFEVRKGDRHVAFTNYWTEAVAVVKVEREAAQVRKR